MTATDSLTRQQVRRCGLDSKKHVPVEVDS